MTRRLAAWATVGLLSAAALVAVGAGATEQPVEDAGNTRGGELYAVTCARCHAADGAGRAAPVAAPPLRGLPVATVDLVLRTGRMPPGDPAGSTKGSIRWSDADREALLAWMVEQLELEGDIFVPPEGDPARGRETYAANCAQCHGYTGEAGVAGAGAFTPRIAALDPVVIAQAIRVGPFDMPPFGTDQIPDQAVGDVVAYLQAVETEESTLVGLVELNPVYLAAFVFLLAVGVVLSCMWLAGRVAMFEDPQPDDGEQP